MAVWGPRLSGIQCKDPGGGLAAKPLEADGTFLVKIIVCHSFKNDIWIFCIHCLQQVLDMKCKKNQFGDRKAVRQATMLLAQCRLGTKSGRPAQ